MADKKLPESDAPFATRIDPQKETLSREQLHYIKQIELEQWKKRSSKMRSRNIITGLTIGAVVLGIYGYTFFNMSQEKIMKEIDEEANRTQLQGSKAATN